VSVLNVLIHLGILDPSATGDSSSAGAAGIVIVIVVVVILIAGLILRRTLRKR
jgi:hypothetical protein